MTIFDKIMFLPGLLITVVLAPIGFLCWFVWNGLQKGFTAGENASYRMWDANEKWMNRK